MKKKIIEKLIRNYDRVLVKQLLTLALPIMLSNFIQTLYNLTDAYFLGKLGAAELSAPTVSFNIIFFLVVFGMSFSMAGTTLIAQSKGKGDAEKVDFYLGQTASILGITSLIIMITGVSLTVPILKLLFVPDDVFGFARDYMTIIFLGIPFMFGIFILQAGLQGIGDTITPLWIQGITILINIILDPLLIFGIGPFPQLGVKGAAIATIFARFIATVLAFIILTKGKKGIKLRAKYMKIKKDSFILFAKIGLPSSIGQALSSLGFTVLQGVVNMFGTSVIAAFGVGNRIISLFNMPAQGISRALTTMVGQSLGAKDVNRAKKSVKISTIGSLLFLVPTMTATFLWGNHFVKFFVNDPQTIELGKILFKIVSPSVVFFGLFTVITGAFQGAGDTKPVMFLSIMRLWFIRVPFAYLLSFVFHLGPVGIWIAMFASNMITALSGFYWFSKGRWSHAINVDHI